MTDATPTASAPEGTTKALISRSADLLHLDPRSYSGMTGLVRFTATVSVRISGWALTSSVGATTDLIRQVAAGEPVTDVVERRIETVRLTVVRALGLESRAAQSSPVRVSLDKASRTDLRGQTDLRDQGDELLRQGGSANGREAGEHPAFSRILRELLPDEARILRFMALAGPQPAIDVRTKTPLGVGSELLATGINLVAEMAGCTHPDRNPQYLANLNRLGMIEFSEEQVEDPRRYSFVEAQPVAAAAMARAKKAMTVYRSVCISQFGLQFCEVCFTLEGYDAGGWLKDVR